MRVDTLFSKSRYDYMQPTTQSPDSWRQVRVRHAPTNSSIGYQPTRYTTSATAGQHIRGECSHDTCTGKKETNRHVVIECDAYNAARTRFTADTGITITHDNYTKVMAIDGISLNVPPTRLATALYRLLANIFRKRYATTNSSVAHSLGHNQGRFAVADIRQPHTPGIG